MTHVNVKYTRICAFCKNWYDPANAAISPVSPSAGVWEYDRGASNMCLKTNLKKQSIASCSKFELKV